MLNWNPSSLAHPLMDGTLRDAEDVGKRFVAADKVCSGRDWVFVHGGVDRE